MTEQTAIDLLVKGNPCIGCIHKGNLCINDTCALLTNWEEATEKLSGDRLRNFPLKRTNVVLTT